MTLAVNSPDKNPRVRLIDVAERAGVSRAAVSRVLLGTGRGSVRVSEDTAERVRAVAQEMNYRPNRLAQQLKGVGSGMVGVLIDTDNRAVTGDRLMAIEGEAASRGIRILVGWVHHKTEDVHDYLADFQDRGVEGLICLFDMTETRDNILREMLPASRRVVIHGRPVREGDCCVKVDTHEAVSLVMRHLVETGRKRIGIELCNPDDRLIQIRRAAYLEGAKKFGLPIEEPLIWSAAGTKNEPTVETVAQAVSQLIEKGRADAIIASNDIWGVRFIQELKTQGYRVPHDVAVTGYDNLELSTVIEPALTTVDQQHQLYAKAVFDVLLEAAAPAVRVIPPRLIVRASTS